jgi:hypothetical protein
MLHSKVSWMVETFVQPDRWTVEIEGMPQFDMAMKRVYAWFEDEEEEIELLKHVEAWR